MLLVIVFGAIACSGTSSSTVQPTTGILIRAETLTTGRGCGRGATNVFKYAAIVFGYSSGDPLATTSYTRPVTANVFDCFTDGAFIALEGSPDSARYRLEVYAYNEAAYTAARADIDGAGTNGARLRASSPTWTTECTAVQQRDVQTLALCAPLVPGLGGFGVSNRPTSITLATTRFRLSDGRTAICKTSAIDDAGADADSETGAGAHPDAEAEAAAAADAETDAAEDAGPDAEPPDAGPPVLFTMVRVRYRLGTILVGPAVDLPCPSVFTAEVASEPARYDLDVGVLDGTEPLGQTTCSVTARTGLSSSAVCP